MKLGNWCRHGRSGRHSHAYSNWGYTAFEGTHRFTAGSMMFVPKHRLHGSVVTAGHCSYHQPVITPELDARFGGSYPGLA